MMNENALGESMNQSRFSNIDRCMLGRKPASDSPTQPSEKPRRRNKENLADRFIPSKISSNAYNMFVPDRPKKQEDASHMLKSQRIDTYEALLSQQILGEPLKSNPHTKKIMHFNQ